MNHKPDAADFVSLLGGFAAEVISELLDSWGDSWRLLAFDLMEVADMCGAKRMDVLWDKRQHPSLSLLQPNLGEASLPFVVHKAFIQPSFKP